MDGWRRWRRAGLRGARGARRAGVTALAVLAVTAGLAVLLAVLFHLDVAAVAVAILGTVPAWRPVPGLGCAARRDQPARTRRREEAGLLAAWPGSGIRWIWACTR